MKEAIMQFDGKVMIPHSPEDLEEIGKEYKKNQLVTGRFTRVGKADIPSIEQGNTLHSCFQLFADNNDNPMLQTKKAVKAACKIGIDYRDMSMVIVRPDGGIQFFYRSFSHKSLPAGREREEVIQKAFDWLAAGMGITVDEMIAEAKSRMVRHP